MNDTILCHSKEESKDVIDDIGMEHIKDCEFLENGKVRLILNCKIKDIVKEGEKENA